MSFDLNSIKWENPIARHPDEIDIELDVDKVDRSWSKDKDMYIGSGGTGAPKRGCYQGFIDYLQRGEPIGKPQISFSDWSQTIQFTNGRHRFSVLRDMGLKKIPALVPKNQLEFFKHNMTENSLGDLVSEIELKNIVDWISPKESDRLKKAFKFFKKHLSLENIPIKISIEPIDRKNIAVLHFKVNEKTKEISNYHIKVSDSEEVSEDRKIRGVAHEIVHVKQILEKSFDPIEKTWKGNQITPKNYWHEPWEIDARITSEKLWIEFNRAIRDGLIREQITLRDFNGEIKKLEDEWDRLDSQGTQTERQIEIGNQIIKLCKEKAKWEKLYNTAGVSEQLLTEVHLDDLYHATDYAQLHSILRDKQVKLTFAGGTGADMELNKDRSFFLSTMRQKVGNYAMWGGKVSYPVIIHLDGKALTAAGYKIFPVNYWGDMMPREKSEQEERIVSDKDHIPLSPKFIKDIQVFLKSDLKNPHVKSNILKSNELAKSIDIPVWFYPPDKEQAFKQHRTEFATKNVRDLGLKSPGWEKDDLSLVKSRKQWNDPNKKTYLDSFIKIYNREPLDPNNWMDEKVHKLLMYYPHDAISVLMADAHNYKSKHYPIFREIVKAMKKEGYKSFRQFIEGMIKRTHDDWQRERNKQ